jgi:hypothetical protein
MKNKKEKLIEFIILKHNIIKKFFNIDYVNKYDVKEIEKWNIKRCDKIYTQIKNNILTKNVMDIGSSTCPWCILYNIDCEKCSYHKRHVHEKSFICNIATVKSFSQLTNDVYKYIINKIELN